MDKKSLAEDRIAKWECYIHTWGVSIQQVFTCEEPSSYAIWTRDLNNSMKGMVSKSFVSQKCSSPPLITFYKDMLWTVYDFIANINTRNPGL